ncbi:uncharacterized protein LY89DRAFT_298520 [Mollisia scopiformis]|uniref:Uncharacterized protein n=1 Tax=Mollisia scopiformis TaxID=149040 RepID=A0A194XQI6_MOLSC|nr:uncharacterized protein LY89DRAFT_298520 [Mollisia scopiformis]KUJ22426.1 hypothetical protein LY89DRAFT_298520 [Mollisia scopiformis]
MYDNNHLDQTQRERERRILKRLTKRKLRTCRTLRKQLLMLRLKEKLYAQDTHCIVELLSDSADIKMPQNNETSGIVPSDIHQTADLCVLKQTLENPSKSSSDSLWTLVDIDDASESKIVEDNSPTCIDHFQLKIGHTKIKREDCEPHIVCKRQAGMMSVDSEPEVLCRNTWLAKDEDDNYMLTVSFSIASLFSPLDVEFDTRIAVSKSYKDIFTSARRPARIEGLQPSSTAQCVHAIGIKIDSKAWLGTSPRNNWMPLHMHVRVLETANSAGKIRLCVNVTLGSPRKWNCEQLVWLPFDYSFQHLPDWRRRLNRLSAEREPAPQVTPRAAISNLMQIVERYQALDWSHNARQNLNKRNKDNASMEKGQIRPSLIEYQVWYNLDPQPRPQESDSEEVLEEEMQM